jgi:hypothetical protein
MRNPQLGIENAYRTIAATLTALLLQFSIPNFQF